MQEYNIENIQEAIELVNQFSKVDGCIFRGQSTGSWKLKQSLFRCNEKYVAVDDHLKKFKKYSIGRIENIEKYSEKEIWAIGQHFGLKTPLLDWTVSAAIALYFAFEQKTENNESNASFYVLDAKELNKEFCRRIFERFQDAEDAAIAKWEDRSSPEENGRYLLEMFENNPELDKNHIVSNVEASLFRIFSPKRYNNPRIVAQRGLFTISNSGKPIEEILEFNGLSMLLRKYLINIKIKDDIIMYLDAHNINPMSMYPDITGAAMYANAKIKNYNSEIFNEHKTDFWL